MQITQKGILNGHEHPIYALAGSEKKHIFFSGGGEAAVVEWSLKKMAPVKVMFKTAGSIYSIHCPKEFPYLITGDRTGQLSIFDFEKQQIIFQKNVCSSPVFGIKNSGSKLCIVSEDGYIRFFDLEKLIVQYEFKLSSSALRCIDLNIEDNTAYISGKDCVIREIELNSLEIIRELNAHTLPVFALAYDHISERLFSGARDAQIKIWKENDHINIPAHLYAVNDLVIMPELSVVASASMDKSIKIWDLNDQKLLANLHQQAHHKSVNALAYTDFENTLISCSDDRQIVIWNISE